MPRKIVASYPDFIKKVTARGKEYEYFDTGQTVAGKRVYKKMPRKSDPNYGGVYSALLAARTSRGKAKSATTVADLSRAYQKSTKFTDRSDGTQYTYLLYIKRIEAEMGEAPVAEIERSDVMALLDKMAATPGAAKMVLAIMQNLMRFAIAREWIKVDPTNGIEPGPKSKAEHEPWPEDILEAALADSEVGLAVALLYYTGQRIGDVCKMRWADIKDGFVYVKQQKTGKELDIQIHADLAAMLDVEPRQALTILFGHNGRPVKVDALRKRLQKFASGLGHDVVPHGLRKNAVNALLEAGCSVGEVSSITGQSLQMVEHYARRRNNRRMGSAAVLKWEGTKAGNRKHLENKPQKA
jgi:integrase